MLPHYNSFPRLWSKVSITSPSRCWLWTAAIRQDGYCRFWLNGERIPAHRVTYELLIGPIPQGLTIDHLCRVRRCVNPWHMEPVTIGVNVKRGNSVSGINIRKTHCKRGHKLSGDNVYNWPAHPYWRACRTCRRLSDRAKAAS